MIGFRGASPWRQLGIRPTDDVWRIHDAYARRSATLRTTATPEAFAQLREARDAALVMALNRHDNASTDHAQDSSDESKANAGWLERIERIRIWGVSVGLFTIAAFGLVDRFFEDDQPEFVEENEMNYYQDASAVVAALFGESFRVDRLQDANADLAQTLIGSDALTGFGDSAIDNARSQLRSRMVMSRPFLPRDQLLQMARLQLIWLRAARRDQPSTCREVTGRSFFDGLPHLNSDELAEEQAIARDWLTAIDFVPEGSDAEPMPHLPAWVMADVVAATGLSPTAVDHALSDLVDSNRCDVTIAVIETLLKAPETAPTSLLVAI